MSDSTTLCPQCQAENDVQNSFCFKCGTALQPLAAGATAAAAGPEPFRWSWVGWSVLIILGASIAVAIPVGFVYDAITRSANIPIYLTVAVNLMGLFLGGMLAGYKSPGVTIKEPAVAAAIVTVLSLLGTKQFSALLLGWVLPYGVTYLGAYLGEKIQGTI